MKSYFRLLSFAKPYERYIIPYVIFALLSIVFGVANFALIIPVLNLLFNVMGNGEAMGATIPELPDFSLDINYFTSLFNYYLSKQIYEHGRLGALMYVCMVLVFCVFTSNFFRYLAVRTVERMRAIHIKNLRKAIFEKSVDLDLSYFSNERKGNLLSRMTTDVQEVENSIGQSFVILLKEPITLLGYLAVMVKISPQLTLFTLAVIPVSGFIISSITKKLKRSATKSQESLGVLLSIMDETFGGMRVIKGFNAEDYIKKKFGRENVNYSDISREMAYRREKAPPMSEFMGVMVVAAILLYGGKLVIEGDDSLSASAFMTYVAMFSQILSPAKSISNGISNLQRGLAAGERIFTILDYQNNITDIPKATTLDEFTGEITFKDVSFSFGDRKILDRVNLTVPKGKMVALVGPSGAGKSTLVDLIPRLYDPQEGAVMIDGHDIRQFTSHSLRSHMGIVTQEPILFNDTIFNNIAFCKEDATEAEVIQAAKVAYAHEFIVQTELGYQTSIGDRGAKLSGGQRQRLSIARAILKNPSILILDEATSALDTESEKLVQEALTHLMEHRTSIVIAHRLSTVAHADEIVVLDRGRIAERGTHQALLNNPNGLYQKLIKLQGFS
jgi:subfamily B ATP-binding cassette protein MsbA